MAAVIELTLKSVHLPVTGREKHEDGVNALGATLYYPREGVPAVASIKELKGLADDEEREYDDRSYRERTVFKELVRGTCELVVEVTAITPVSTLDKVVAATMKSVATAGFGLLAGPLGSIVSGGIVAATGSLFDAGKPKDRVDIVGRCSIEIDEDMGDQDLMLLLKAPADVTYTTTRMTMDGPRDEVVTLLDKGQANGAVVLTLKRLPTD